MNRSITARSLASWTLLLAIWVLLTKGEAASWLIGLPAVIAAAWIGSKLSGGQRGRDRLRVPHAAQGGGTSFNQGLAPGARAKTRARGMVLSSIPGFVWYFVANSLRGGFDVAQRVFRPRLAIAPGFLIYRTRLRHPTAQVFFLNLISLLPGTLSADFAEPDRITIHALDTNGDNHRELARLEDQVARLFHERPSGGLR